MFSSCHPWKLKIPNPQPQTMAIVPWCRNCSSKKVKGDENWHLYLFLFLWRESYWRSCWLVIDCMSRAFFESFVLLGYVFPSALPILGKTGSKTASTALDDQMLILLPPRRFTYPPTTMALWLLHVWVWAHSLGEFSSCAFASYLSLLLNAHAHPYIWRGFCSSRAEILRVQLWAETRENIRHFNPCIGEYVGCFCLPKK